MFISVKINYNPLSKERLKRICFLAVPVAVSLAITMADYFYKFIPSFRMNRLFLYMQLFAELCAVIQVLYNSKTDFYAPVDSIKIAVKPAVIWGSIFALCHIGFIQFLMDRMHSTVVFYSNNIAGTLGVLLLLPYALVGIALNSIFNMPFSISIEASVTQTLGYVLVGFVSVYCLLGAVIRLVKTNECYKNLELVKR